MDKFYSPVSGDKFAPLVQWVAAGGFQLGERAGTAVDTWRDRARVRRAPRRVVVAWLRLEAAVSRLAVGSNEFATAVEAAVENNTDALDELRGIAPDLAALVDDLSASGDGEPAAALLALVEAIREQRGGQQQASSAAHTDADEHDPPQLHQIERIILRHGPTAASRELLAA